MSSVQMSAQLGNTHSALCFPHTSYTPLTPLTLLPATLTADTVSWPKK